MLLRGVCAGLIEKTESLETTPAQRPSHQVGVMTYFLQNVTE